MWPFRTGVLASDGFMPCFLISLGAIAMAYPSSIVASTLAKPSFLQYMGLGDENGIYEGKQGEVGTITALFQAGAVVGLLSGSEISDRFGRRSALLFVSIISIIGSVGVTAAQNMAMLLIFRFFTGAGSYAYLALVPGYISELATPKRRGLFGGLCGTFIGFGYCCASFVGLAFYYIHNEEMQWRGPFAIGILWPVMTLATYPFIPESPRFLLMKNRPDEAWNVVSRLHADPSTNDNSFMLAEFSQMKQQADYERTLDRSWLQLFKKPSYRKRLILIGGIKILGQSTAVLVLNNYGPIFYAALGFQKRDQLILAGGRDVVAFLGNMTGAFLMDNFGRRRLLLTGFGGCLINLCIFAAMVAEVQKEPRIGLVGVGMTALFTFLVFYAFGVDAATYVYAGEIFPGHIRSKGMALSVIIAALTSLVYLQVTPLAVANIGWKYFLVFISVSAVGFVWAYFNIFETKHIPLEEIGEKFGEVDEVAVHLSEAMAESAGKGQNFATEHIERSDEASPTRGT
ncbi:general substrate transporter [Penicillium mononematosum]|uniref:general substrate transporter n=1 Tax=Penicillium mononematosum TaxID=268346 RepID=UPI00254962C1|nr:general substrate transporter [Penicillium mononematosum]KAJ6187287.1 general substrate transporter [Penicillium mononematosum]